MNYELADININNLSYQDQDNTNFLLYENFKEQDSVLNISDSYFSVNSEKSKKGLEKNNNFSILNLCNFLDEKNSNEIFFNYEYEIFNGENTEKKLIKIFYSH